MLRRAIALMSVLGCLAIAPLAAQEPQSSPPPARQQSSASGPRITQDYPRYEPAVGQRNASTATAADRVTITITTLGLVLLIVLLVLLIA